MAVGEPTADPTDPPTVAGAARWGATLSSTPGGWTALVFPVTGYQRQWQRCTTSSCVDIAGATGATYTLTGADVGRRVRIRVYAVNDAGPSDQPAYSNQTAVVVEDPPNNGGPPTFSGEAREGEALTRASYGSWSSPTPTGYALQWLRCDTTGGACSAIAAATTDGYQLTAADVGKRIRLRVSATGPYGDAQALSGSSAVVEKKGSSAPGSTGKRRARRLSPFPRILVQGALSPRGALFHQVVVKGPRNVTVRVRCRGHGCPYRSRSYRMRRRKLRLRSLERNFSSGAVIELRVVKRGRVGKYTRIRIRRGHVPSRVDRCLNPGSSRPRRCGK
jgi:hypothetical protein